MKKMSNLMKMADLVSLLDDVKEYFDNDGVFSIDLDDEEEMFEVSMYSKNFMKTFHLWSKEKRGNDYRLSYRIKDVVFLCSVPVDMYEEYMKGVEF